MVEKILYNQSLKSILLAGIITCLTACLETVPPDFQRTFEVVDAVLRPEVLVDAGFPNPLAEAKPSDFIRFSSQRPGNKIWPPTEEAAELKKDLAIASLRKGVPLRPGSVGFQFQQRHPEVGRQIVLRADDSNGLIIGEAYIKGQEEPVATRQWVFPPQK